MKIKKKMVLITGGSRGIGKAIVDRLQNNYTVMHPTRSELNLLENESIERFVKKHKNRSIDIIINNAGVNSPAWIEEITDQNLHETFQINLIAPIRLIRGLVGSMKKKRWGRIVNMCSAFSIVARGKQVLYVATKHGLDGVTKTLALELASYNILVNSVSPGFTRTELVTRNSPEKIKAIESDIPLGRLTEPKEIAEVVEFLISERNTYITGANIVIDGGFSVK